jgi:hypothetical protein
MLVLAVSPAFAEFQISGYGGWNGSFDSDIHLSQPGGTDLDFKDVPWDGDSFGAPPYWGARGTWWFNSAPSWGFMIDYNHAKVIADQSAVVGVSGTRDGVKIGPIDRVGNTFETMEFTDGLNEMFFGGQYRWLHERWTPYVGLGVGFAFPHVNSAARRDRLIRALSNISSMASRPKVWSVSNTPSVRTCRCSVNISSATRPMRLNWMAAARSTPIFGRTMRSSACPIALADRRCRCRRPISEQLAAA